MLYNTQEASLGNTKYYNGNISAVKWQTNDKYALNDPNFPRREKSLKFTYDNMDRLRSTTYAASDGTNWNQELGAHSGAEVTSVPFCI